MRKTNPATNATFAGVKSYSVMHGGEPSVKSGGMTFALNYPILASNINQKPISSIK